MLQFQQLSYLASLIPKYYRREHSALLQPCQSVFPHVEPPLHPPNHFHLLLQISGTHCQIICHLFQLFLFLEELSNITYSSSLTLTVVRNLVRSNQLDVSQFVIHCQLLPSHSPEIQCRPSKGVPSERLRLVNCFISHRLHQWFPTFFVLGPFFVVGWAWGATRLIFFTFNFTK